MEFGHSPEETPQFIADFNQAMRLFGEAQRQPLNQINSEEYDKAFCTALLAAYIAEKQLFITGQAKPFSVEQLGISFEPNEPITFLAILEKGVKAAGGPNFSFKSVDIHKRSVSPTEPLYARTLKRHFIFGAIQYDLSKYSLSSEDILHSLITRDNRVVINTSGFRRRT